jgi:hypothetical protein
MSNSRAKRLKSYRWGPIFSVRTKLIVDFSKILRTRLKNANALFGHNTEIFAVAICPVYLPLEFKRFTVKVNLFVFICSGLERKMTCLIYSCFGGYLGSTLISGLASKPICLLAATQ